MPKQKPVRAFSVSSLTIPTIWYMVIYAIVVIGFTFLYTALIFNPKQIADNLKQNNGFIPGVKPGQPTADYIGVIMDDHITRCYFASIRGYFAGYCTALGCYTRLLYLLWWYIVADYGRCNIRYAAANRNTIADAPV